MARLYRYQEQAVDELLAGKHIIVAEVGTGKGAVAMKWAERECMKTEKDHVVVVTTASKAKMNPTDYHIDAERWCAPSFLYSLSSFSVISWAKFAAWVNTHWGALENYVVVLDEIAAVKNGVGSQRGRAFLKLAKRNKSWAGFTATPGENWLHFYPYFQACGLTRNKTQFLRDYAVVQTFKGYPEIVRWLREDHLRELWARVSHAPDTRQVLAELPEATHTVVKFKKPQSYAKTLKTRQTASGELLDTTMKLAHTLRQMCFTKDKQEWVRDFVENLGTNVIIFYNYIEEGETLAQICQKVLPKGTKVWRIDGRHKDIPTEDTIGERDVVLCHWQSGSEGLNAQFIDYWLSVSPTYSYTTSIQARGRIQRIGAKRTKHYYYMKASGTIEVDIYRALKEKRTFSEENWAAENNLTKGE